MSIDSCGVQSRWMCGWRTSLLRREYTVVNDVAATASMKYLRNVIVLPSRCRVVARARTAGSAESLLTSSSKSFGNDVSDDSQRGRRFDSGSRRIAGLDWASPKLVTLRCDAGQWTYSLFREPWLRPVPRNRRRLVRARRHSQRGARIACSKTRVRRLALAWKGGATRFA